MTETFTWRGDVSTSGSGDMLMSSANFGDGYSQDVPYGLQNEKQKWTVVVKGYKHEVQPALDFIRAHKGQVFFWTPPLGTEGYYKCKRYNISDEGGASFNISFEFEQGNMP